MLLFISDQDVFSRHGAGHWKDWQGLKQCLEAEGVAVRECAIEAEAPLAALDAIESNIDHIVVNYSRWPELVIAIRENYPYIKLHVRAHNAEALQTWQRRESDWWHPYWRLRDIYGAARVAWMDRQCCQYADTIWSISHWDTRNYWQRLAPSSKILDVSYSCPWPGLEATENTSWTERSNTILSLPGGRDSIGLSSLNAFFQFSERVNAKQPAWQCAVTAGVWGGGKPDECPDSCDWLGKIDNPYQKMQNVKAVAMLTDLGFGFKTTVADALAAGCHVIVHPKIYNRLTPVLQPHVLVWQPGDKAVGPLLDKLAAAPECIGINELLKSDARKGIRQALQSEL